VGRESLNGNLKVVRSRRVMAESRVTQLKRASCVNGCAEIVIVLTQVIRRDCKVFDNIVVLKSHLLPGLFKL